MSNSAKVELDKDVPVGFRMKVDICESQAVSRGWQGDGWGQTSWDMREVLREQSLGQIT